MEFFNVDIIHPMASFLPWIIILGVFVAAITFVIVTFEADQDEQYDTYPDPQLPAKVQTQRLKERRHALYRELNGSNREVYDHQKSGI